MYTLNDQQKCCCFSSHEEGGGGFKHIFILLVSRPQKQKGHDCVCGSLEPVKAVWLFGPAALHVNNSVIIDFISIPALSASLHLFPLALLMHLKAQQALHSLWGCKTKQKNNGIYCSRQNYRGHYAMSLLLCITM